MSDRTAVANRVATSGRVAISGRVAVANRRPLDVLSSIPWIAQWRLDRNYLDSIGVNHLTATGSPTFTTGILAGQGASQLVNASSQRLSRADNAALSSGNVDYLVSLWAYFDSISANRGLIGKNDTAGQGEFYILYVQAANRIQFRWYTDGTAFAQQNWSSAPVINTWYHVLFWHDATLNTVNGCINNGTPVSAAASGGFDGTDAFYIGRVSGANYMDGRTRNVCVAKGTGAVPTAAQRTALYNGGNGQDWITA